MRIAMSSYSGYGFWFVLRLLAEGHKVDTFLSIPEYADILEGIIPSPKVRAKGDRSFPPYGKYDLSLFDLTGREKQSEFSASLCPTMGDGAFNNAVENDRMFGVEIMERCGIKIPPYKKFTDTGTAKQFISKTNKRYVYKPDGGQDQDTATTYVSSSAEDMIEYLDKVNAITKGAPFILQEVVLGTEVSVEGYFNGEDFYLLNCTLEEKKFMNKNHGPNTGCAGNLVFNFGLSEPRVYVEGLKKMIPYLTEVGYRGMIDLNTIATKDGLYGLEWTPRFGYDASATLFNTYQGNLGEMLHSVATGKIPDQSWNAEFGAAVRLSIPPYPSELKGHHPENVPIKGIDPEDLEEIYLYDAKIVKDKLVTAGHSGMVAVVMGKGNSIGDAFEAVEERIKKIKIPNMQMRTDIKETTSKRYAELMNDGWLK